jgi:hypothetical protein
METEMFGETLNSFQNFMLLITESQNFTFSVVVAPNGTYVT